MPTAAAISPHLDDAVFSCGGTLARLTASGWRVVVVTVFTASVPDPTGFALACQLDKGLGPEVDYMALRRDEDAAALRALGAEPMWLGLPEAPHRGYGSAAALFGPVRDDDAVVPPVAAALADLLGRLRPNLLLAPQAIGGHVDHVQVVRACPPAATAILWWQDFPYLVREPAPAEPFRDRMATLPEFAVRVDVAAVEVKRRSCRAYVSQLGFQFGGPKALDERLAANGDIERFRRFGTLPAVLVSGSVDAAA